MEWAQTFTIIISLGAMGFTGLRAFWRVFSHTTNMIRADVKEYASRHEAEIRQHSSKYDEELRESRKLWADLFQKSHEIEKKNHEIEQERKEIQRKMYELEQSRRG